MYMNVHVPCILFILPSDIYHTIGNGAGHLLAMTFTRHPLGRRSCKRGFGKALVHGHVDVDADDFHC